MKGTVKKMKNITIKIIALMLVSVMAVLALVACQPEGPEGPSDESPSASDTGPEETPAPIEDVVLAENGKTNYKVIRSQTSADYEIKMTGEAVKGFKEKSGIDIFAADDWVNEAIGYTESEFEILIGKTARAESRLVYSTLRADDYAVTIVDKKIVIAAHNEEKLGEALAYFLEKLTVSEGKTSFLASDAVTVKGEYEVSEVTIGGTDLKQYKIIRKSGATDIVKAASDRVADKLLSLGYKVSVGSDDAEETEYEIVFGATNRGSSAEQSEPLRALDYKIYMEGTKLYILTGSHTDSVNAAADHLIEKLDSLLDGGKIAITAENIKTEYESDVYKTKQVILNGTDIKEYTVVYSNSDKISLKLADLLCDVIEETCGRRLNLVSDNRAYSGSKEIIVGYSKRLGDVASAVAPYVNDLNDNEYLLFSEGDFIYAGGKQDDNVAVISAVNRLINKLVGITNPEKAELTLETSAGTAVAGSKYSIMTYNDGDNSYQNIADRMTIVKEYMPDIICFQETQTPHAQRYKNSLQIYDYVLYDNDGTTYNSQPIFWKKDKFELVDSGIKWLSDTPDKRSKFADSEYYRSMTYAILKDKATGEQFVVVNTHLDFAKINAKQTEKLLELTEGFRDMPMLCLGDFNLRDTDKGYQNMYNECFMDSGRYLEKKDPATIDFCFIDITKIVATDYKVISDHELSKTASDHFPVYTEFVTGLK